MIWKCHHSFCDGVSVMTLPLALSDEFDRSYFVRSTDLSLLSQILLRLSMPLYIPSIVASTFLAKHDFNFFTNKKYENNLTGELNVSSSPQISVQSVKNLSKKLNISINDIILSSLTTSLKSLFMQQNDDTTQI